MLRSSFGLAWRLHWPTVLGLGRGRRLPRAVRRVARFGGGQSGAGRRLAHRRGAQHRPRQCRWRHPRHLHRGHARVRRCPRRGRRRSSGDADALGRGRWSGRAGVRNARRPRRVAPALSRRRGDRRGRDRGELGAADGSVPARIRLHRGPVLGSRRGRARAAARRVPLCRAHRVRLRRGATPDDHARLGPARRRPGDRPVRRTIQVPGLGARCEPVHPHAGGAGRVVRTGAPASP